MSLFMLPSGERAVSAAAMAKRRVPMPEGALAAVIISIFVVLRLVEGLNAAMTGHAPREGLILGPAQNPDCNRVSIAQRLIDINFDTIKAVANRKKFLKPTEDDDKLYSLALLTADGARSQPPCAAR